MKGTVVEHARYSREGITMIETASFTSFVVIPRAGEHGGYENECFTHYVQGNGGRCCLRGPMVQSDAEWLANKMNTQWADQPRRPATYSVWSSLLYSYTGQDAPAPSSEPA